MTTTMTSTRDQQFRIIQILAFALLVAAPLMYLLLIYYVIPGDGEPQRNVLLMNILLGVSALQLVLAPMIVRVMIKNQKQAPAANAMQAAWIIRMAMIESIFIYGLVYFFITKDRTPVLYFYVVGAAAAIFNWPTRDRFDNLATSLEEK